MIKIKLELSKKQMDVLVKAMQGISNPVRFTIVYALLKEELSVSDLSGFAGVSQSVTSQHLGKLKDIGLLDYRKESNKVFYYIKDGKTKELIKQVVRIYSE